RMEARHCAANRLHATRKIAAADLHLGCAPAEQGWRHHAHDVRIAAHDVPVARVDRRRMHPYHQVVWTGQRLFDFFELEDLRRAVALLNNRFHVVNTSTLDPWLRHRRRRVLTTRGFTDAAGTQTGERRRTVPRIPSRAMRPRLARR